MMHTLWYSLTMVVAAAAVFLPAGRIEAGAALALAGVLAAAWSRARARGAGPDEDPSAAAAWPRETLLLLAPLAVLGIALPPVGLWGCAAAAVGLIARVLAGRRRGPAVATEAILGASAIAAACAALQGIYGSLWARALGWSPLAAAVQAFTAIAGWDAQAWGATLILRDGDIVHHHALTAEALLPFPLFCLALIASAVAVYRDRSALGVLRLLSALVLFCGARFLLLVRLTVEGFGSSLFWSPTVQGLSVLAAAPLLAYVCLRSPSRRGCSAVWQPEAPGAGHSTPGSEPDHPAGAVNRAPRGARRAGHLRLRGSTLLLATVAAVALSLWTAAGMPKAGRVLIDESHSQWSRTLRPFDTRWFGNEATYNYASFAEYLTHFFRVTINERTPLTPDLLAGYDVLLLKMPTRPFAAAERAAIHAFVRGGGGLWLIGDHTNVFGTTTYLNPVSKPLGLRFRDDATWDLASGGPALWESPGAFAPHPVVRGVRRFEFQTGCSLQADFGAQDVMVAPRIIARRGSYGTPNFFPENRPFDFNGAFGPALLAAATHHGAGRVVAFTDSTSFSTFSMFAAGRPELAVNTVAWLNGRNRSPWPARAATLLALATALWYAAGVARSPRNGRRWTALAFGLTVLIGGGVVSRALTAAAVPPTRVRPEAPLRRVYFLTSGSGALFENLDPLHWNVADDPERERRFTTFLIGTQRFGLVPTLVSRVPSYDPSGDLLVIAHPHEPLPPTEARRLEAFVRRGGRVLVLPDNRSAASQEALDALLAPFGMRCAGRVPGESRVDLPQAGLRLPLRQPFHFHGGEAIARDARGREILALAAAGNGFVLAVGDGQLFVNATLGNHFDVPSGAQRDATAAQMWLVRHLLLEGRRVTRTFPEQLPAGDRADPPPLPDRRPGQKGASDDELSE